MVVPHIWLMITLHPIIKFLPQNCVLKEINKPLIQTTHFLMLLKTVLNSTFKLS